MTTPFWLFRVRAIDFAADIFEPLIPPSRTVPGIFHGVGRTLLRVLHEWGARASRRAGSNRTSPFESLDLAGARCGYGRIDDEPLDIAERFVDRFELRQRIAKLREPLRVLSD